jgi:hypothetical protein
MIPSGSQTYHRVMARQTLVATILHKNNNLSQNCDAPDAEPPAAERADRASPPRSFKDSFANVMKGSQ